MDVYLAAPRCPTLISFCGNDVLPIPTVRPVLSLKNALTRILNRFLARTLNRAIVKAAVMKTHLVRFDGWNPERIDVLPNGIDLDRFSIRDRSDCRRELGLASEGTYALSLGDPDDDSGVKRIDLARRSIGRHGFPRRGA